MGNLLETCFYRSLAKEQGKKVEEKTKNKGKNAYQQHKKGEGAIMKDNVLKITTESDFRIRDCSSLCSSDYLIPYSDNTTELREQLFGEEQEIVLDQCVGLAVVGHIGDLIMPHNIELMFGSMNELHEITQSLIKEGHDWKTIQQKMTFLTSMC